MSELLTIPALALRGLTVFPNMLLHFDVGRATSIRALNEAFQNEQPLFLISQRDLTIEEPQERDLYTVGTVAAVRQILRLPGDNARVLVEGRRRGQMVGMEQTSPFFMARVREITGEPAARNSTKTEAMIRQTYGLFEAYINLSDRLNSDVLMHIVGSNDPGYIADYVAQNVGMRVEDKQLILEELRPVRRLERLMRFLQREVEILSMEEDLEARTREQVGRNQRSYFLREQMKVIQSELGEESEDDGPGQYRRRVLTADLPGPVREKLLGEVARLERQHFGSAEATVITGYLDVCLELPWTKTSKERLDVSAARRVLEAEHFGMEKVKERILEFLSVKQLAPDLKGQILCLVGPPGVGKTSIAGSVARAMRREMARISLGGVHDEAEIRGHRKTYVGAMPGRILAGVRQAGTRNPLLLLDEIDKLGSDHRGDPASALLEVLDSEQNAAFRDNFVELPFDLSDVLFIATANTTDTIPRPLLDRMEVIELSSYTDEEKLQIAKRHLLPKQMKRHGLTARQLRLTPDAIRELITGYTRESGVRVLERQLAALCRKAAMRIVTEGVKSVPVNGDTVKDLLGPPRFHPERLPLTEQVGVVSGLAWTRTGGELLAVEVNVVPGSGKVELTGNLGDVMKESAHAALSCLRSRAAQLGLDPEFHKTRDLHVHFPEGATPKDGPSAGIAIATAMVSALTGRTVRRGIAMTGEISLRGRVLPIGGLREKTMAALRNGIHTVILPAENLPDLSEIDPTVYQALRFLPADHVDTVLENALSPKAEPMAEESHGMPAPCGNPPHMIRQ